MMKAINKNTHAWGCLVVTGQRYIKAQYRYAYLRDFGTSVQAWGLPFQYGAVYIFSAKKIPYDRQVQTQRDKHVQVYCSRTEQREMQ